MWLFFCLFFCREYSSLINVNTVKYAPGIFLMFFLTYRGIWGLFPFFYFFPSPLKFLYFYKLIFEIISLF